MELSIGEFAAACRLSVPALRRYAEAGVLLPARVDEQTGYRWYATAQVSAGVLVRTLRQLDVPLRAVAEILAAATPAAQLARLDDHWTRAERAVLEGRSIRDHLARLLGGWQGLIAEHEVHEQVVSALPVLLRRRQGDPRELSAHVATAVTALQRRAERDGLVIAGWPVSAHPMPFEVSRMSEEWTVEVCLPVHTSDRRGGVDSGGTDGFADAVLPEGRLIYARVGGRDREHPQVLAAFGAVAQWAYERELRLSSTPLMVHEDSGWVRVGWCLPALARAEPTEGPEAVAVRVPE